MQEEPNVLSFASIYDAPPLELDSRIGRLVKLIFKELRLVECASVVWEGAFWHGLSSSPSCESGLARCPLEMNDCQRMQRWNDSSVFSFGGVFAERGCCKATERRLGSKDGF